MSPETKNWLWLPVATAFYILIVMPALLLWIPFGQPWFLAYERWHKGETGTALLLATAGNWPTWAILAVLVYR